MVALAGVQRFLLITLIFVASFVFLPSLTSQLTIPPPFATNTNSWTPHELDTITYPDGSIIKPILRSNNLGPSFACGFYHSPATTYSYLFAIFVVVYVNENQIDINATPQVVWSARSDSRSVSVDEYATLALTNLGSLTLTSDDDVIWRSTSTSTSTTGNVVGMNMTDQGNLVIIRSNHEQAWQSFDYPTDTWLPGQSLPNGQKLIADMPTSDSDQGSFYITPTTGGLLAYVDSKPDPQLYLRKPDPQPSPRNPRNRNKNINMSSGGYALFQSGHVSFNASNGSPYFSGGFFVPRATSLQFMRLHSDGHLRVHAWNTSTKSWVMTMDVMSTIYGFTECDYPTVCGEYGICSSSQDQGSHCSCPVSTTHETYFKLVNVSQPSSGCLPITPLSCKEKQVLLNLTDVSYFNYVDTRLASKTNYTTEESCRKACLRDCSCKAALFQYNIGVMNGNCFLPTHIYSLKVNQKDVSHYNSIAYIKVQDSGDRQDPPIDHGNATSSIGKILGSTLASLFGVIVIGVLVAIAVKKKQTTEHDEIDEDLEKTLRFSYEELAVATDNFHNELGQGGFGSVFEGRLKNGTRIAVKQLGEDKRQGEREFLSEVKTIGRIHHVNLVSLLGFCIEKSHMLLVYEYMSHGSLDKWIFRNDLDRKLSWQTKCNVIKDIARGLLYLHEDCKQRIVHLDIKPQNILLDEKFNAKVSDFGLSRPIEREESCIGMSKLRGTKGYMAPEMQTSIINVKADVYSFGVVLLEIICGRKNIDPTEPEETVLLETLKDKAEQGLLLDFVNKYNEETGTNSEEAVKLLHVAIWCMQIDPGKRPSMSEVVKVLEGSLEVDMNKDNELFGNMYDANQAQTGSSSSAAFTVSAVTGPR